MFVFSSNGVGTKHFHHFSVIRLFLVKRSIFEQAMFFNPSTIDNDFGFFVSGSELGSNMSNAAFFLNLFLYLFINSTPGRVTFKTTHLYFISNKDFYQPCVNDVR